MKTDLGEIFVRNLKACRVKRGLTQSELSERAGLYRGTVASVEGRFREPSIKFMERICEVLDVPAWTLLCEDGDLMDGDGGWADQMSYRFRKELWVLVDDLMKKGNAE